MKHARFLILAGSVGLLASVMAVPAAMASPASHAPRIMLRGSLVPALERKHPAGNVPAKATVKFDMVLKLRNAAGAKKMVREVSSPHSKMYKHFLTDKQWYARFGPTAKSVSAAEAWLRHAGFRVVSVPKTHLFVTASGSAAKVEKAFGVKLGYYMFNGHRVRLAKGTMSIPSSLGSAVSGVAGVNETLMTTSLTSTPTGTSSKPNQIAPPAAFRNPQPCGAFWGAKTDTADNASLYAPFTSPLPYDICGYVPGQIRGAYGINTAVAGGDDGSGVGVAIVDAYDSPTLEANAQKYANLNDPTHPLSSGQFFDGSSPTFTNEAECGASGWFAEQALDVEAIHGMAPGAEILFAGAQSCLDSDLLAAENVAVTSGASVVSNSWGSPLGDLLEDPGSRTAFDNTFMLADVTGVSVLFSSGDDGDNFADFGLDVPDYPSSSPFITSVGGTTLEINSSNARQAEFGWSTAKSTLCASATKNCGSATSPATPLAWQAGGGGGSSFFYSQPFYQAGVVPSALALRNKALFGNTPVRVEPDVAMDADAQSGMLIGLRQTFPHSVKYGQFKEGGTSLACPLLAGMVADADQAAGGTIGFLNPALYTAWKQTPTAFNDILPPTNPNATAVIRVDFANTINNASGFLISNRAIDYEGVETNCDGAGNCESRNVTLNAAPGFDSLTGLGSVGPNFLSALSKF
jgi:subtilase family serine protease